MSAWRSEALARFQAAIATRRDALGALLAGLLILAGVSGADPAAAGRGKARRHRKRRRRRRRRRNRCQGGFTRCDGVCVDTQTDPLHCGGCDDACDAGETCRNGVCGCDVCDDEDDCPFQTVQAAVDAAAAGAAIAICKGSYDGNIVIGKNLTLTGAGEEDTKLEGEDGGSVVTVAEGAVVTIHGLTISGGTGTLNEDDDFLEGGGVFNHGTLTLREVVISNNQAERGGGILNDFRANLTLDHTMVVDNEARTRRPTGTFGGGILNLRGATLTIGNGSEISRNRSLNAAGIHNNGTLVMSDSLVEENAAAIDGGGILNDQGLATLSNTHIRRNSARDSRGGGIFHIGFEMTIDKGSEVRQNSAGTTGGGIFSGVVARLTCTDAAILDNDAGQDGGGIFSNGGHVVLERTPVRGNDAGGLGGGVFQVGQGRFEPASLTLTGTVISDNRASEGGGIFNTDDGIVELDDQSSVTGNNPNNCVDTEACQP